MKQCTKCKLTKPISSFGISRQSPDGYQWWCKICCRAKFRSYRSTIAGRAHELWSNARRRAKISGLEFTLTRAWILDRLLSRCPLTGRAFCLEQPPAGRSHHPNSPSIDRIDPRLGYTEENCRLVVFSANFAKAEMSDQELIELATDILRTISSRASQEEGSTTISKESRTQASPKPLAPLFMRAKI